VAQFVLPGAAVGDGQVARFAGASVLRGQLGEPPGGSQSVLAADVKQLFHGEDALGVGEGRAGRRELHGGGGEQAPCIRVLVECHPLGFGADLGWVLGGDHPIPPRHWRGLPSGGELDGRT
jgi:hypothetical protein